MDHELKQRLIGAVVVTALAAIFIPMLFDDPVDTSGKTVTELTIPQAPADPSPEVAQNLPADKNQVLNRPDTELSVSEDEEMAGANAMVDGQEANVSDGEQTEQPAGIDSQESKPADDLVSKQAERNNEPTVDDSIVQEPKPIEDSSPSLAKPTETTKKPKQLAVASVKKTVVSEKPKPKAKATVKKVKAVTKTPQDSTQKVKAKVGRYSIQAGSFSKKENAQALVEKLRKQGMSASIASQGDFYRVKIGPELDKKKAADMKSKLDKQNIKSLLISE